MKKNLTSVIAVVLCLIMAAGVFTACSKNNGDGESTTLAPDESWAPGSETYQPVTITDVELAEIVKEALGDDASDFNGDLSSLSGAQLSKVKQTAALNGYIVTKDENGNTVIQKDNIDVTDVDEKVYDEVMEKAGVEKDKTVSPSQYERVSRAADEKGVTAVTNGDGEVKIIDKVSTTARTASGTTKATRPSATGSAQNPSSSTKAPTQPPTQASPTTSNIAGSTKPFDFNSTTAPLPSVNIKAVSKDKGTAFSNGGHTIYSRNTMDSKGNVYSVGSTLGNASGKKVTYSSGLIVKTGSNGKVDWKYVVDGGELTSFNDVALLNDGSIIAVGDTLSTTVVPDSAFKCKGTVEGIICKFSANGKLLWTKIFGGSQGDIIYAVTPASDGGFIIGGRSSSTDGDLKGVNKSKIVAFISKCDSEGNVKWVKGLSGSKHSAVYDIAVTQDGSIFTAIESLSSDGDYNGLEGSGGGRRYCVIAKFKSNGDSVWKSTYYEGGSVIIHNICAYDNGVIAAGYYTAGKTGVNSGSFSKLHNGGPAGTYDGVVFRVKSDGTTPWYCPLIGFQNDYVTGITAVNGGFAVSGYTNSTNRDFAFQSKGDNDSFVYVISTGGRTICAGSVGGAKSDRALGICGNRDQVVICGSTLSSDGDFADVGAASDGTDAAAFNYSFNFEH